MYFRDYILSKLTEKKLKQKFCVCGKVVSEYYCKFPYFLYFSRP